MVYKKLQCTFPKEYTVVTQCNFNTRPLIRGDLILPADQLISNKLAQMGNLKFKKIQICIQSGQAKFDLGESVFSVSRLDRRVKYNS